MPPPPPRDMPAARFTATARWLHWAGAAMVLAGIAAAWRMLALPPGAPARALYFSLHKSLGVTVLLVTLARLAWRARHPAPPPAPGTPRWSAVLARADHLLLYALLLAMPLSGYLRTATDGHALRYFGLLDLPTLPPDAALSRLALALHHAMRWPLYALILLHLCGTAWHVAVRRDGVLARMLPPRG